MPSFSTDGVIDSLPFTSMVALAKVGKYPTVGEELVCPTNEPATQEVIAVGAVVEVG